MSAVVQLSVLDYKVLKPLLLDMWCLHVRLAYWKVWPTACAPPHDGVS